MKLEYLTDASHSGLGLTLCAHCSDPVWSSPPAQFRDIDTGNAYHEVCAVEVALRQLGDEPDVVAGRLSAMGCTGIAGDPATCPLANYLGRVFAPTGLSYEIGIDDVINEDDKSIAMLPDACLAFVDDFDAGRFDFLSAAEP